MHCNRPCSALHPPSQCTASFPANVCIRHRKRLHPGLQTLSSVLANVITEKTPSFKNLFPCFSTEPAPSKVCAPEAQRPGEGRTTPYIYIYYGIERFSRNCQGVRHLNGAFRKLKRRYRIAQLYESVGTSGQPELHQHGREDNVPHYDGSKSTVAQQETREERHTPIRVTVSPP